MCEPRGGSRVRQKTQPVLMKINNERTIRYAFTSYITSMDTLPPWCVLCADVRAPRRAAATSIKRIISSVGKRRELLTVHIQSLSCRMNRWVKRGLVVVGAVCAASLIHYYITHRSDEASRRPQRRPGSSQQQAAKQQQQQIAVHAPLPDPREVHCRPTITILAQHVCE